jgi:hypothetical protein
MIPILSITVFILIFLALTVIASVLKDICRELMKSNDMALEQLKIDIELNQKTDEIHAISNN